LDYFCITDNKNLRSKKWKIIIDESRQTAAYKNRKYKLLPHLFFKDYKYSLYVDSNIKINISPYQLMCKMMAYEISMPKHSKRSCVYDEANACYVAGKLSYSEFRAFKNYLYELEFPRMTGLTENGIIFRRHNSEMAIKWGGNVWMLYNSIIKRDQLISPLVVLSEKIKIQMLPTNAYIKNGIFSYRPHVGHTSKNFFEKLILKIKSLYRRFQVIFLW